MIGSESLQCDVASGQCQCRPNIEGRRCDECVENMYDLQAGCRPCPPCYGLVQRMANEHREELRKLRELLSEIVENPVTVNDTDFDNRLTEVALTVRQLADKVKESLGKLTLQLVSLKFTLSPCQTPACFDIFVR